MLVLDGRGVGLKEEQYQGKNGLVNTYDLSVATDDGVLVVRVPQEVLNSLGSEVYRVKEFGVGVQIKCWPNLAYNYGKPEPGLKALALRLVEPADSPNGSAPADATV
jgi:hypothetical protein